MAERDQHRRGLTKLGKAASRANHISNYFHYTRIINQSAIRTRSETERPTKALIKTNMS